MGAAEIAKRLGVRAQTATTEPVVMELLAGARSERDRARLKERSLSDRDFDVLARRTPLRVEPLVE